MKKMILLGIALTAAADGAAGASRLATLQGHTTQVRDVAFSSDGTYLASSAADQTVQLWDVRTGQQMHSFTKPSNVAYLNSLSFSPDGRLLASPQTIWNLQTYAVVKELAADVIHIAFSPDGSLLAVDAIAQPIRLLDTRNWAVVRTFESQSDVHPAGDDSFGFEFSPDGTLIAAGGLKLGIARIWNVAEGTLVRTLSYGSVDTDVHDVAFATDGRFLAAGGTEPWARIFDVASGEATRTFMLEDGILSLDVSPNDRVLAITRGTTASLWEIETGNLIESLPHGAGVFSLAFSPDGRVFACGLYDGTVALWDVADLVGEEKASFGATKSSFR